MNIEQIAYEEASGEMLDCFSKEQLAGYPLRCLSKLAEQDVEPVARQDSQILKPTDTSALETLTTKAGEVMREKCCELIMEIERLLRGNAQATAAENANAIRALLGVTLGDLQK